MLSGHLCGNFKDIFDIQVGNSNKRLAGDINVGVIS